MHSDLHQADVPSGVPCASAHRRTTPGQPSSTNEQRLIGKMIITSDPTQKKGRHKRPFSA